MSVVTVITVFVEAPHLDIMFILNTDGLLYSYVVVYVTPHYR
jgi:hypothetical protein